MTPAQANRADTIASRLNSLAITAAALRRDLNTLAALVDLDAADGFPGVADDAGIIRSVSGAVDLASSRLGVMCSSWIGYAQRRDAESRRDASQEIGAISGRVPTEALPK